MPWYAPSKLDADGKSAIGGYVKQAENFTFMKVSGAGHMVPTDQPEIAYDMITEFMSKGRIEPI